MRWFWGLLLTGCGASLPAPEFEAYDARVTPGAPEYPDAKAVVLLDRGELLFTVDAKRRVPVARRRRLHRLKILREEGQELAKIVVPYDPGTAIFGLHARVRLPDGSVTYFEPEERDVDHVSGRRAKVIKTVAPVGSILEHTYDVYADDLRFLEPWIFQTELPTVRSEFAVVVPEGYSVDLRYSKGGAFLDKPPERFDTDQGARFSWSEANLRALFPEDGMPHPELLAPRAHVVFLGAKIAGRQFTGFTSWDDVSNWFLGHISNWAELTPATVSEAKRVAGDSSEAERALKLMEVLARDVAPDGFPPPPWWRARPVHPENVLREKKAHPTSRGMLLVALMRASGIDAVPALYAYRDKDLILPDVPTVYGLSGVAAVVRRPEGPLVLDPSQLTASEKVPSPRLQGTRIVALLGDTTEVIRVPVSAPEDSTSKIEYQLELTAAGELFGQMEATFTGAEAGELRTRLLGAKPEDYASLVGDFVRARGGGMAAESVNIADLESLRRPLVVKGPVATQVQFNEGTEVFLPLSRIVGAEHRPLREIRRAPLEMGAPRKLEIRATLTLPEDFSQGLLPNPSERSWSGGRLSFNVRTETRRRLGIMREEIVNATGVETTRWEDFRRFAQEVRALEEQPIVLNRPATRSLEF